MLKYKFNMEISIHTPTQGVTDKAKKAADAFVISIHTPTQGVTLSNLVLSRTFYHFNPHSHAGSDSFRLGTNLAKKSFQSTLPRRE